MWFMETTAPPETKAEHLRVGQSFTTPGKQKTWVAKVRRVEDTILITNEQGRESVLPADEPVRIHSDLNGVYVTRQGDLTGANGNTFAIVGNVKRHLRQQDAPAFFIKDVMDDMMSDTYAHVFEVLRTRLDWADEKESGLNDEGQRLSEDDEDYAYGYDEDWHEED